MTALNRLTVERSNNGGKDVAPNEAKITIISHSTAMAKLPDISGISVSNDKSDNEQFEN